jgi:hypothetical protein
VDSDFKLSTGIFILRILVGEFDEVIPTFLSDEGVPDYTEVLGDFVEVREHAEVSTGEMTYKIHLVR